MKIVFDRMQNIYYGLGRGPNFQCDMNLTMHYFYTVKMYDKILYDEVKGFLKRQGKVKIFSYFFPREFHARGILTTLGFDFCSENLRRLWSQFTK